MNNTAEQKEIDDMKNVEKFLVEFGFVCSSSPSAQNKIYLKNGDVIMIKNNKK